MRKALPILIVCSLLSLTDTVGNGHAPRKLNKTEKEMEASKHKHYHYCCLHLGIKGATILTLGKCKMLSEKGAGRWLGTEAIVRVFEYEPGRLGAAWHQLLLTGSGGVSP